MKNVAHTGIAFDDVRMNVTELEYSSRGTDFGTFPCTVQKETIQISWDFVFLPSESNFKAQTVVEGNPKLMMHEVLSSFLLSLLSQSN